RYEEVYNKLASGEVRNINDLITYNLNIRQFAQDVIENCEGPELLRAFYHAIEKVTILDPTCGSGAFLFAALNILEPLYEACLDRMQVFLDELDSSGQKRRPEKFSDFRKILEQINRHPNRRYFILKSIIINNLFGVDIMEEAVEICKLRLFLKLVAQVEKAKDIEPLPDIDFNIRAGNTLVGFARYDEVKEAVNKLAVTPGKLQGKLLFDDTMKRIEEKAEDVDHLFDLFRQQQTELGGGYPTG
ncbi:MAG TPA: SAM-dependent methyltransferase, partial [Thermodesulfobacteriota bacterium]|nr:SAM-dependent methyltransferase [Thermodesulfobacteriota bacterium]